MPASRSAPARTSSPVPAQPCPARRPTRAGARSTSAPSAAGRPAAAAGSATPTAKLRATLGTEGVLTARPEHRHPALHRPPRRLSHPAELRVAPGRRARLRAPQRRGPRPHRRRLRRPAPDPRLHRHGRDHPPDLGAVGRRGGGVRERALRERHRGRAADQPDGLAGLRPRRDPQPRAGDFGPRRPLGGARQRPLEPAGAGRAKQRGSRPRDRVRRRRHRPPRAVHGRGRQHPACLAGDGGGLLDRGLRVRARRFLGRGAAAPQHGRFRGRQRLGVRAEDQRSGGLPRVLGAGRNAVAAHVPGGVGHAGDQAPGHQHPRLHRRRRQQRARRGVRQLPRVR